jgi:hypothetical protein
MSKEIIKDLEYWKANAEEDYMKVPISVLRYISELEKQKSSEEDTKDYLQGFIDLHNNELEHWDAVEFLEWLKLNDFKIVKK